MTVRGPPIDAAPPGSSRALVPKTAMALGSWIQTNGLRRPNEDRAALGGPVEEMHGHRILAPPPVRLHDHLPLSLSAAHDGACASSRRFQSAVAPLARSALR